MFKESKLIDKIRTIQTTKNTKNSLVHDKLYRIVENRVLKLVNSDPNIKEYYYKIPTFIGGYPFIDVKQASISLIERLEKEGFTVFKHDDSTLHIKWDRPNKVRFYVDEDHKDLLRELIS